MKFVFIFGPSACGKMTVGQELSKITDLTLFYNHQTIEPIIDVFGYYNLECVLDVRNIIFEYFAKTENDGMIFTMMFDFDNLMCYEYVDKIKEIFNSQRDDMEYYFVELKSSLETRLIRNKTENRLNFKPSKRNIKESEERVKCEEITHRCNSLKNDILWPNYYILDNENISAEDAALMIKKHFNI